ncbi:MAG TPA: anaerobic ribonucleoside-triphosphate reductase activating protein [Candidatus Korarchaeota archaeon]|nr:anaerobic ribonucleoside-triphosphate reductase activating protein [Candidatus Korarchaeota archaeon]
MPRGRLLGAGWRPVSMVDVVGAVVFTVWLCGCNVRCPFCHNHRIADSDPEVCGFLDVERLLEDLSASKTFLDYFHVTGGEPLVQWRPLAALLERARGEGVRVSVNTNLTLPDALSCLLRAVPVDHIATDLKVPPGEMYGVGEAAAERLWRNFIRGLMLVADQGVPLELRVPVRRDLSVDVLARYAGEALSALGDSDYIIVLQPLVGPPLAAPRDEEWCSTRCNPPERVMSIAKETMERLSGRPVSVRVGGAALWAEG